MRVMAAPLEIENIEELEKQPFTKTRKNRELGAKRRVLPEQWQTPIVSNAFTFLRGNFVVTLLCVSMVCNLLLLGARMLADTNPVHVTVKPLHHHRHLIPFCAALPSFSSQDIWNLHIGSIHRASHLHADKPYKLHDLTAEVLQLVSPRLVHSVKSLPRDWTKVARIIDKLWVRYEYLVERLGRRNSKENRYDPYAPPPVRIVVMGGNVAAGNGCMLPGVSNQQAQSCAWPFRLEGLFNQLLLGSEYDYDDKIVQVTNVAVSATHSGVGKILLEHDVLSDETDIADIIINAYSTNDDHDSFREALQVMQDFYRQALEPHPCKNMPSPLLLHLNDAFGDREAPILKSTVVAQVAEVLSTYYGSASISYVDVVRDWIYGDARESWFSSDQQHDVPGHGVHLAISFIVAFNLLHYATTYCTMEPWHTLDSDPSPLAGYDPAKPKLLDGTVAQQHQSIMPPLRNASDTTFTGKPRPPPRYILPPLDERLSISQANLRWTTGNVAKKSPTCERDSNGKIIENYKKCPFSWVSDHGVEGQMWWLESVKKHASAETRWKQTTIHLEKPGLVPPEKDPLDSVLELLFENQKQRITNVVLFYEQSYLNEWKDSLAKFEIKRSTSKVGQIEDNWSIVATSEVSGYHEKDNSEMRAESLELSNAIGVGESLRIRATLVQGTKFKIMGIALCSG